MHFQLMERCVKFPAFRVEPCAGLNDISSMHLRSELTNSPAWRAVMAVIALGLAGAGPARAAETELPQKVVPCPVLESELHGFGEKDYAGAVETISTKRLSEIRPEFTPW